LQTINRKVAGDLDVHIVLDNTSTHKTPAIQRWFAEGTSKLLKRGSHRSVAALNADIRA
jgi:hypothetical protein